MVSLKKLRTDPLKVATYCVPFGIKELSQTYFNISLNHLDLSALLFHANQFLIWILSKKWLNFMTFLPQ